MNNKIERNPFLGTWERNYLREGLRAVGSMPAIFTAKCVKICKEHVLFAYVAPYIKGLYTRIICDHACITRAKIDKFMDSLSLVVGKRYHLVCHAAPYGLQNQRLCLQLAFDVLDTPIISTVASGSTELLDSIQPQCCAFDPISFRRKKLI